MRVRTLAVVVVCGSLSLGAAGEVEARNLRRTLGQPVEAQGGPGAEAIRQALSPLGAVIGAQIANQIPTLSTSAGFTYEYNPELEVYERSTKTFGPLFAERAVTIGKGKFNVNFSYSYIDFAEINGRSLDELAARVEVARLPGDPSGQRVFFGLRRGDLADQYPNLTADQIFTKLDLDLDLEAQLFDFSFTYGLLDNLDVNIDIPLLRTFARSTVNETTLDPRFVDAVRQQTPSFDAGPQFVDTFTARESAFGVGDIRLRSKYLALTTPVRLAGLLDLVLPTGSPGNFQGTGDTRLGVFLIGSDTLGEIFEPHAQAGVEFNADDVDRSQAKYLAGVTTQLGKVAALTVDFIGRSEFGAQTRIPSTARLPKVENGVFTETQAPFHGRPFIVDIKRNDVLDLAVGGKVSVTEQSIFFATVLIPLNQDGIRADVVPTVGYEMTF